jgi:quercetin dioxygenase-like cupin family protein
MLKAAKRLCIELGIPALLLAAAAGPLDAQLLNVPLPALGANQEMLVLEIALEPGQASAPHRHNAHVFVYVLEGSVTMQVAGQEPVTLSAGQVFYENPDDIHLVSRNASDSAPARFLAHIIKTVGVPVSTPVSGDFSRR